MTKIIINEERISLKNKLYRAVIFHYIEPQQTIRRAEFQNSQKDYIQIDVLGNTRGANSIRLNDPKSVEHIHEQDLNAVTKFQARKIATR